MKIIKKTKVNIQLTEDEAHALMTALGEISHCQHIANGLTEKQSSMVSDLYFEMTDNKDQS
jgi:hypothetical protein